MIPNAGEYNRYSVFRKDEKDLWMKVMNSHSQAI